MAATFFDRCPILLGAVQARVVGARFAAAVRSFRPGKTFFDGVGVRFGPFSLLRPGKQFCDGATPSDVIDSPWIFKPSCFPADACFPLLCFLWRHFFDFLSLATLHGAMADGNAAFDLNVRLEEDGDYGFDLNNGNTSLLCLALLALICLAFLMATLLCFASLLAVHLEDGAAVATFPLTLSSMEMTTATLPLISTSMMMTTTTVVSI